MIQKSFRYDVLLEIELTGSDLVMLRHAARGHYDIRCRNFFVRGTAYSSPDGRGAEWWSMFEMEHGSPQDNPDKTFCCIMSSFELDRCVKILSSVPSLGFPPKSVWALLNNLKDALARLQEESRRLHAPVD